MTSKETFIVQPLWKAISHYLVNVKICILYDPAVFALGRYLREIYVHMHQKHVKEYLKEHCPITAQN